LDLSTYTVDTPPLPRSKMADKKKNPTTRRDEQTMVKERIKRPRKHKVVLHNDDFTPMEFVVEILESVYNRTGAEATRIMLTIHRSGIGIAGVFSREIAEAKAIKTVRFARESGYPLLCTTEPE
jgi:ATP-dependent Clp protease adaptor protein ClpS